MPEEVSHRRRLLLVRLRLLQQLPQVRWQRPAVGGGDLLHDGYALLHAPHGQQPAGRFRKVPPIQEEENGRCVTGYAKGSPVCQYPGDEGHAAHAHGANHEGQRRRQPSQMPRTEFHDYDVRHLVKAEESEAGEEPGCREQFFRRDQHVQETKAEVDEDGEEENGSPAYSVGEDGEYESTEGISCDGEGEDGGDGGGVVAHEVEEADGGLSPAALVVVPTMLTSSDGRSVNSVGGTRPQGIAVRHVVHMALAQS